MKNKMYQPNQYFLLSSSCKVVKGKKRSLIIDYLRREMFFIPNDYYNLLLQIDRKPIVDIFDKINEDSKESFNEFIQFLTQNELGFLTNEPERFPKIDDTNYDQVILKDVILELDENYFDQTIFDQILKEIDEIGCHDLSLRYLSPFNINFIKPILEQANNSNLNYIELHVTNDTQYQEKQLTDLLETTAKLSHLFVYGTGLNKMIEHYLNKEDYISTHMGNVYLVKNGFDNGNCCGIIDKSSLSFEDVKIHNELKIFNGCLYKKLTIDKEGNFKNCPSINQFFGNASQQSIKEVLANKEFQKLWTIKKDDIEICKDCEFRYNCTDCRAFLQDSENIYSKPLKCGYNPDTCEWEEWSINPLKNQGVTY